MTLTPDKPDQRLSGISILVVEDNLDCRVLIAALLEHAGASVELAENGQVGVDKATTTNPDVVLMDLQMPVLNGLDAIAQLRVCGFTKPTIIVSASMLECEKKSVST